MSFLQNSTTFAPYLNMKPHRTYILYISICLWLLASPLCIGNLWGKDFVVVIDAGHGGHDPGAIGKISKEKNINLNQGSESTVCYLLARLSLLSD